MFFVFLFNLKGEKKGSNNEEEEKKTFLFLCQLAAAAAAAGLPSPASLFFFTLCWNLFDKVWQDHCWVCLSFQRVCLTNTPLSTASVSSSPPEKVRIQFARVAASGRPGLQPLPRCLHTTDMNSLHPPGDVAAAGAPVERMKIGNQDWARVHSPEKEPGSRFSGDIDK